MKEDWVNPAAFGEMMGLFRQYGLASVQDPGGREVWVADDRGGDRVSRYGVLRLSDMNDVDDLATLKAWIAERAIPANGSAA